MRKITKEEAQQFLNILERIDDDMGQVMKDTFDDELTTEEFREKWNSVPGTIYTDATRKRYEKFVKKVYLEE